MTTFTECGLNGRTWDVNEKYSHGDFTDVDLSEIDPAEFDNTCVINSCFYQSPRQGVVQPYNSIPANMQNVRFIQCNMDNVSIPAGADISDDGWNRNSNQIITG
jgi:hypothetical protein